MNGRRALSDVELERALKDVATRLEDPPAGDLSAAVRARLEAQSPLGAMPHMRRGWLRPRTRFVVAGVAIVVAATLALTSLPGVRDAVADWFSLRGVFIEHRATPPSAGVGARLSLGEQVSLAEAQRGVTFEVLLPSGRGRPDEVYLADTPSGGRISLLYRPRSGLPPAAGSRVGLLATEFRARINDQLLRKGIGADVRLEDVTVASEPGFWIEGNPHQLIFADERGRFFEDNARLAGNTVLWQRGPITLRVESGLSKAEAIRIAESLSTRA
jgi:hypothetical protein